MLNLLGFKFSFPDANTQHRSALQVDALMNMEAATNRLVSLLNVFRMDAQTESLHMTETMGTSAFVIHQIKHDAFHQMTLELERDITHLMGANQKVAAALGGARGDL